MIVMDTSNPSTGKAEADRSLESARSTWVSSRPAKVSISWVKFSNVEETLPWTPCGVSILGFGLSECCVLLFHLGWWIESLSVPYWRSPLLYTPCLWVKDDSFCWGWIFLYTWWGWWTGSHTMLAFKPYQAFSIMEFPRVRGHGGEEPRLLMVQMVHIFYPGDFELFSRPYNSKRVDLNSQSLNPLRDIQRATSCLLICLV